MSSRNLSPAVEAATLAPVVRPVYLVELDFESGVVRAHSGVGDFKWGDKTFVGVGHLGKISEIEETEALQANGIRLELSGIPQGLLAISLGEHYQGRPARVWIAFLDEHHRRIVEPVGPFSGRMDTMDGELGKTATITLAIESRMADWERPKVRRYTHADQQAEYPDDFGLEFVSAVAEMELLWGVA